MNTSYFLPRPGPSRRATKGGPRLPGPRGGKHHKDQAVTEGRVQGTLKAPIKAMFLRIFWDSSGPYGPGPGP